MASNELDSFISGLKKTSRASTSSGANPKQEKGQYFVDPNTGQYYFQSGNGEAMAIVPSEESEANTNPTNNQVVLNTGGDQYQTVTIVPSDGNTGEVCKIIFLIFHLFSNVWFISYSKCSNFGVEYRNCHRILDVYLSGLLLIFCYFDGTNSIEN